MLNEEQVKLIEEELNVVLLLQTRDTIIFMEKETEKQVVLDFKETIKEAVSNKLHPPQKIEDNKFYKNNDTYTWVANWSTTINTT